MKISTARPALNIGLHPLDHVKSFNFGTWDIEAKDWWTLQCIGAFDGENYYHFRNVDDFLDHIMQKKYRNYRWFAHFGGRYDMNFIFDRIRQKRHAQVDFFCSGSMVIRMKIKRSRNDIVYLCDSFRLLPAGLRELTKAFDVKHKKGEYDFENMEYSKELLEYNEMDCRGLYEVLESFFEQLGIRSETFATQALRFWRKKYLKRTIWQPHDNVSDFIRRGLHGGHVEVFKRQSNNLKAYDVNSMYPYVMQFPVPVDYIGEKRTIYDNYYGFIEATVTIPEMYIPPLPYKMEKLFFPTGTMTGVWTSEELREAEKRGVKILRIIQGYHFKCEEIFAEYVAELYALKKRAGEPTRTIAKYLLNSLFGKFGQHPEKKVYCTESEAPIGSYPILTPDGNPSGFAEYTRRSRSAYLLPHISASITSKARLVLLANLTESSFYCDTDSIFTTDTITTGDNLGEWGFVGEGEATFYQPKLYKFKGRWKCKGLNQHKPECKRDKSCLCGSEMIDAFVDGDINKVVRRKSIKEALRTATNACSDVEVEKRLGLTRPKRVWLEDNQETRPWNIKELEK